MMGQLFNVDVRQVKRRAGHPILSDDKLLEVSFLIDREMVDMHVKEGRIVLQRQDGDG